MRFPLRAAFFLALAAGLSFHHLAWAQSDSSALIDRMDHLERDLQTLQLQVYRNQGGASVMTSPALGGGATAPKPPSAAGLSGDTYSQLDDRLNALETQLKDLTGQLEKSGYATQQLQSKLDRSLADSEIRFKELEQKLGGGGAAVAGSGGTPAGKPPAANAPGDWNPTMGSPPGNLVHSGGPATPPSSPPAAPENTGGMLPGKTPAEKYDFAFGLLRASDYDGATKAFQTFVAQNAQDPLAGNAMYWLGQIPYTQGNYDQAIPLFLDAYRKYPKSAKASESLLKVGLSLSNLGKKKEACAAIARFLSEYSDAADNLKRQATAEKSKLGC